MRTWTQLRVLTVAALVGAATLAALVTPATADAYRIDRRIVPQPTVRWYSALPDWKAPMRRAAAALNRAKVGVRLVEATIPQQASVQVGRLETRCGFPGVSATTQTLVGGYALIYLPRRCNPTQASIIAAHELGHALGLRHENRRCALMNSSGTGSQSIPTRCIGRRYDWRRRPWRSDDLAGLKALYRNTAPRVTLRTTTTGPYTTSTPISFAATASDREKNLSELTIDFGDGEAPRTVGSVRELPTTHTFLQPGTYTVRLTARDFYLKRATATVTVTVTAG